MKSMQRSVALAYVLWFFLGYFGIHRIYCGRVGSGLAMLALTVLGSITFVTGIGHLFLFIVGVWWLIDLFLTANMALGRR
jgi:TM2 domain-containing membrane protein YozV